MPWPAVIKMPGREKPSSWLDARGTAISSITATRSWKSRMPIAISPWRVLRMPRLVSSRETMAVDDSERPPARMAEICQGSPNNCSTRKKKTVHIATCRLPSLNTVLRSTITRGSENSRPRIKSRKVRPSSAMAVSSSGSVMTPSPVGPNRAPVRMNASSELMRTRYSRMMSSVDVPSSSNTEVSRVDVSPCNGRLPFVRMDCQGNNLPYIGARRPSMHRFQQIVKEKSKSA